VSSDVKALLLSPGANVATALPAGRGPDLNSGAATVNPPGVLDKRCQPAPKIGRMLGAQIKLVRRAFQRELNRLVGRAAGQVVLELYLKPLHRLPPKSEWPGRCSAAGEPRSYPGCGCSIAGVRVTGMLNCVRPRSVLVSYPSPLRPITVLGHPGQIDDSDCYC
jgi:hypothetical protein